MATTETTVELIPLQRIVRQEKAGGPVEIHEPGPDAEPFEVPESEVERLIARKAAKRADEVEDDEEEGEGETAPKAPAAKKTPVKKKSRAKKAAPAPQGEQSAADANPSLVAE